MTKNGKETQLKCLLFKTTLHLISNNIYADSHVVCQKFYLTLELTYVTGLLKWQKYFQGTQKPKFPKMTVQTWSTSSHVTAKIFISAKPNVFSEYELKIIKELVLGLMFFLILLTAHIILKKHTNMPWIKRTNLLVPQRPNFHILKVAFRSLLKGFVTILNAEDAKLITLDWNARKSTIKKTSKPLVFSSQKFSKNVNLTLRSFPLYLIALNRQKVPIF